MHLGLSGAELRLRRARERLLTTQQAGRIYSLLQDLDRRDENDGKLLKREKERRIGEFYAKYLCQDFRDYLISALEEIAYR